MRIDATAFEGEGRRITRTRAGLGSGLELVIHGAAKDIHANVPVTEEFAQRSPFLLMRDANRMFILDGRSADTYAVDVPPEPKWYSRYTSADVPMHRVGVM